MRTQPTLTILMPLKGRHLHTLRLLWHANRSHMPYRFLIADGGEANPQFTALLQSSRDIFPDLDVSYVRYPEDATYTQFYHKMADASARVRTPYVMQAENDDFLIQSGIDNCLAFLQSNLDFASCSGGIGGFELLPTRNGALNNIVGGLRHVSIECMPEYAIRDDTAFSVAERIRSAFSCIHTNYYNVFRSETLATILRELAELDLTDLQLHEVYFGMRAVSLGKAQLSHHYMSYMRQGGTGMTHPFRTDWSGYVVRSRFTTDLNAVADRIAKIVAALDRPQPDDFAAEVRDMFGVKLGQYLRNQYGSPNGGRVPWSGRIKKVAHVALPKRVSESIHYARSREFLFRDLGSAGASRVAIAAFQKEWGDIEFLLNGREFVEFLYKHAPFVLHQPALGSSYVDLVQ